MRKREACSRYSTLTDTRERTTLKGSRGGVASLPLQKDIQPLSDRPIRWLPTDGEKKISDDNAIAGRAKRKKTENERPRETFKAFRGITRKSYYRKRILPFVFGEWFATLAPLFRIFIGWNRSNTFLVRRDDIFEFSIFTESIFFFFIFIYNSENFEF